jgi:hypothetical protein
MVRTEDIVGVLVRFERHEHDGQEHPPWTLRADLEADGPERTALTMHLFYGGSAWLPGLEVILGQEVRSGAARLARKLT